jgi:hypothetical protein
MGGMSSVFFTKYIMRISELLESIQPKLAYHFSPAENMDDILEYGLNPKVGMDTAYTDKRVYLFLTKQDLDDALGSWIYDRFGEEQLALFSVNIEGIPLQKEYGEYYTSSAITPDRIKLITDNLN